MSIYFFKFIQIAVFFIKNVLSMIISNTFFSFLLITGTTTNNTRQSHLFFFLVSFNVFFIFIEEKSCWEMVATSNIHVRQLKNENSPVLTCFGFSHDEVFHLLFFLSFTLSSMHHYKSLLLILR